MPPKLEQWDRVAYTQREAFVEEQMGKVMIAGDIKQGRSYLYLLLNLQ